MENINGIKHKKSDKINNLKNYTLRNYITPIVIFSTSQTYKIYFLPKLLRSNYFFRQKFLFQLLGADFSSKRHFLIKNESFG